MNHNDMKVLIGLALITLAVGAYHHTEKEIKCLSDKNETDCIAGSFINPCGTVKCFRTPGQSCKKDEKSAILYGSLCHSSLICNKCGQCVGTVYTNNGPITGVGNCLPELGKRNNINGYLLTNFMDSNEVQFQPIPSPVDV